MKKKKLSSIDKEHFFDEIMPLIMEDMCKKGKLTGKPLINVANRKRGIELIQLKPICRTNKWE